MITKEEANEMIQGFNASCRTIELMNRVKYLKYFIPGDKVIWSDTLGVVVDFDYPFVTVLFDRALNPVRLHCRVCNIGRVI
jgi:hypothetical protein